MLKNLKWYLNSDALCCFGETHSEKYEYLHVKLVEMSNMLLAGGASADSLTITVGRALAMLMECERCKCCGPSPEVPEWENDFGRYEMGKFHDKWNVTLDDSMADGRVEMYSDKGGILLEIAHPERLL